MYTKLHAYLLSSHYSLHNLTMCETRVQPACALIRTSLGVRHEPLTSHTGLFVFNCLHMERQTQTQACNQRCQPSNSTSVDPHPPRLLPPRPLPARGPPSLLVPHWFMSVPAMLPLITTVSCVSSTTAMHSVSTSNIVLLLWKTLAVHLLVLSLLGVLVFVGLTSSQRPSLKG